LPGELNVRPKLPSSDGGARHDWKNVVAVLVIVALLISTIGLGYAYSAKNSPTLTSYVTSYVTCTLNCPAADPIQFYLTYSSTAYTYFFGQSNQSANYRVNASVVAASVKYEHSVVNVSYFLVYSISPNQFWQPVKTVSLPATFSLNISQIFQSVNLMEGRFNYTVPSPIQIMANFSASSQTIYSMQVARVFLATQYGDYVQFQPISLAGHAIP